MGTTYYIHPTLGNNGNTGLSTAQAKLTITGGASLAVAGDTVVCLTGSYQTSIYINTTTFDNGTSASPITIMSVTPFAAKFLVLSPPAANSGNAANFEVRCNSWIVDGFEVHNLDAYTSTAATAWSGGGTALRVGIFLTGDGNVARNNYVHDICKFDPAGSGGSGMQSEYFYGGSSNAILNNHVHRIGSSVTSNKVHGIYISCANNSIQGNLVYDCFGGVGIHGWHGMNGGDYTNNTVFNCNVGLLIGQGDGGAGAGVAGFRGFNNIVFDCDLIGIQSFGSVQPGNIFSTNLVFDCPEAYRIATASVQAVNRLSFSPTFVNYIATGGGDYRLSVGSAAINAGLRSLSGVAAPSTDLDGNTRPISASYDCGAYEFGTFSATASSTASANMVLNVNFFGGYERKFTFT